MERSEIQENAAGFESAPYSGSGKLFGTGPPGRHRPKDSAIAATSYPKLRDFPINGRFEVDKPDRVLDALAKTLHIEVRSYTP